MRAVSAPPTFVKGPPTRPAPSIRRSSEVTRNSAVRSGSDPIDPNTGLAPSAPQIHTGNDVERALYLL